MGKGKLFTFTEETFAAEPDFPEVDVHVTGFPSPTAPEQDRLQVFVCGDDDAALEAARELLHDLMDAMCHKLVKWWSNNRQGPAPKAGFSMVEQAPSTYLPNRLEPPKGKGKGKGK